MPSNDDRMERMIRALADPRPLRESLPAQGFLRCEECGRIDFDNERGWALRLDCFDELQAFCPECDEREFGDAY